MNTFSFADSFEIEELKDLPCKSSHKIFVPMFKWARNIEEKANQFAEYLRISSMKMMQIYYNEILQEV